MQARGFIPATACLLVLVAGIPAAWAGDLQENQDKAELEKQLQQLVHERVETAQLAKDAIQAAFDAGTIVVFDLLDAVNELAEARLAVAKTPAERIDALEKHVKQMKAIEEKVLALYRAGARGGEVKEYFSAKRERQSAEIALLKARLEDKP